MNRETKRLKKLYRESDDACGLKTYMVKLAKARKPGAVEWLNRKGLNWGVQ